MLVENLVSQALAVADWRLAGVLVDCRLYAPLSSRRWMQKALVPTLFRLRIFAHWSRLGRRDLGLRLRSRDLGDPGGCFPFRRLRGMPRSRPRLGRNRIGARESLQAEGMRQACPLPSWTRWLLNLELCLSAVRSLGLLRVIFQFLAGLGTA